MPLRKLLVGYSTRGVDNIDEFMPKFEAPTNFKDEAKIREAIEKSKTKFREEAAARPYTGILDKVVFIDPTAKVTKKYMTEPGKTPPAARVRNYLLKEFPRAWVRDPNEDDAAYARRTPEVMFIGFDTRRFLKLLGLECSLPGYEPCPLDMWHANSDHRDIATAVLPDECGKLDFPSQLKFRRPKDPADAKKWDAVVTGWTEPGVDADKDVLLTGMLAAQILLIP